MKLKPLIPLALLFALTAAPGGCEGEPTPTAELPEGFITGINLPWFQYGGDFGANGWGHFGVSGHRDAVADELAYLRSFGVTAVRWFVYTDGRAAPEFDEGGDVAFVDDLTLADFDAALSAADEVGMSLVPVFLDFYWCAEASDVGGVTLGGHADLIEDPARRAQLINNAITPLLQRYGDHPNILAWEVINEPEWVMDGHGIDWLGDDVSAPAMQAFVDEVTAEIHAWTDHPATVGSADKDWMAEYWLSSDVDVLQYHDYSGQPFTDNALIVGDGRPVIVGEFPSSANITPTLSGALAGGFAGAWPWSHLAEDSATGPFLDDLGEWVNAHPAEVWVGLEGL